MKGWAVEHDGALTRLARRPGLQPAAAARAVWREDALGGDAVLYRVALAHQVRQDLWRALRDVRGFQPVVEVSALGSHGRFVVTVEAGSAEGAAPAASDQVRAAAEALLGSAAHRRRWRAHARRKAREG